MYVRSTNPYLFLVYSTIRHDDIMMMAVLFNRLLQGKIVFLKLLSFFPGLHPTGSLRKPVFLHA